MVYITKAVPNVKPFIPLNEPAIGTPLGGVNEKTPLLFQPITIGGITFKNRIFVSPMCQYSSDNGHASDWHLVHFGGFASGGASAIVVEATAVVPEGRTTPEDAGLWQDSQIAPLKRIVDYVHSQGTKIGIQFAHAGRKASTHTPWVQVQAGKGAPFLATQEENGWPDNVYGPSELKFEDTHANPKAMTEKDLDYVEKAYLSAVERAKAAGFDFIELHMAHGYLFHNFYSPLSNVRTDSYGGQPLENRLRFPLRVAGAVRKAWAGKPLFVRLSATEWAEGPERDEQGKWLSWGIQQTNVFCGELQKLGVDMIDCSTGGNWVKQKIPLYHGYQVPFAEAIKKAHPNLNVGSVGLLTDPHIVEGYLQEGRADVVLLGRGLLRDPYWPIRAGVTLAVPLKAPHQYEEAWTKRAIESAQKLEKP